MNPMVPFFRKLFARLQFHCGAWVLVSNFSNDFSTWGLMIQFDYIIICFTLAWRHQLSWKNTNWVGKTPTELEITPLKTNKYLWTMMIGSLVSFWDWLFLGGELLNFRGVMECFFPKTWDLSITKKYWTLVRRWCDGDEVGAGFLPWTLKMFGSKLDRCLKHNFNPSRFKFDLYKYPMYIKT